eukprot:TRINITY_DN9911_c0_g5_i1.p1 TRINITY_DN9911_c0_g5~~TRINITY_DN9911_c0_g5_i1.p1  ORF type:complete len:438 (+),score=76.51 TRINITY_DN9911_c0_g5_i1:59-1315(+)
MGANSSVASHAAITGNMDLPGKFLKEVAMRDATKVPKPRASAGGRRRKNTNDSDDTVGAVNMDVPGQFLKWAAAQKELGNSKGGLRNRSDDSLPSVRCSSSPALVNALAEAVSATVDNVGATKHSGETLKKSGLCSPSSDSLVSVCSKPSRGSFVSKEQSLNSTAKTRPKAKSEDLPGAFLRMVKDPEVYDASDHEDICDTFIRQASESTEVSIKCDMPGTFFRKRSASRETLSSVDRKSSTSSLLDRKSSPSSSFDRKTSPTTPSAPAKQTSQESKDNLLSFPFARSTSQESLMSFTRKSSPSEAFTRKSSPSEAFNRKTSPSQESLASFASAASMESKGSRKSSTKSRRSSLPGAFLLEARDPEAAARAAAASAQARTDFLTLSVAEAAAAEAAPSDTAGSFFRATAAASRAVASQ